jgi:cell division protein FtsQ
MSRKHRKTDLDYREESQEYSGEYAGEYAGETVQHEYDWPTENSSGRKRKKRRKKHYFLKFLLFVAICVGGYFLATSDAFSITTIDIRGNEHFTAAQVSEMSAIPKGANMWETRMGAVEKLIGEDPYIETVEISRKPLHRIVITVKERHDDFVVKTEAGYAVLDFQGYVLRVADEPPDLPVIENIGIVKAEPGYAAEVKQNLLLTDVIAFLKKAEKSDIYFKRIIASDVTATAYIYDHLTCRGTFENLTANMEQLRTIYLDLDHEKIKRGTIIVSGNGTCTFSPEEA